MKTICVFFKSIISATLLLVVSACGSSTTDTANSVSPELQRANQTKTAAITALKREFAALVPEGQRLEARSIVGTSREGADRSFSKLVIEARSAVRTGQIIVQFDMSQEAPIYRIITEASLIKPGQQEPENDMLFAHIWVWENTTIKVVAPNYTDYVRSDGLIVTPWIGCDACFSDWSWRSKPGRSVSALKRVTEFLQVWTRDPALAAKKRTPKSAQKGKEPKEFGISPLTVGSGEGWDDFIVSGREAAIAWANRTPGLIADDDKKREAGKVHYGAYKKLQREVEKASLVGYIADSGCAQKHINRLNTRSEARETLRHNDAFIDCRVRALKKYDHEAYARNAQGYVSREQKLAKAAYGVKRFRIYTPKGQINAVTRQIRNAELANDDALGQLKYYNEQRAARERSRKVWQSVANHATNLAARTTAELRDVQPVVRRTPSGGTVLTNAGAERARRSKEAAAAAAQNRTRSTSGSTFKLTKKCAQGKNPNGGCVTEAQIRAREQASIEERERRIAAEDAAARRELARNAEEARQKRAEWQKQRAISCGYNSWEEYIQKTAVSCQ